MDRCEKISGEFVVAGRNGSKVLNFIEEALNEVALAVKREIAIAFGLSVGFGGNYRRGFSIAGQESRRGRPFGSAPPAPPDPESPESKERGLTEVDRMLERARRVDEVDVLHLLKIMLKANGKGRRSGAISASGRLGVWQPPGLWTYWDMYYRTVLYFLLRRSS